MNDVIDIEFIIFSGVHQGKHDLTSPEMVCKQLDS